MEEESIVQIPPAPLFFFLHALYSPVPSSEVLREKTSQGSKYTFMTHDTKMISCRSHESSY